MKTPATLFALAAFASCAHAPPQSATVVHTPGWQETVKANAIALGCTVDGSDATQVVLRPCVVLNHGVPASSAITAQPFRANDDQKHEQSVRFDVVAKEQAGVVVVEVVDCVVSDDVYVRQCPDTEGIALMQKEAVAALSVGFPPFGS